jgi:AraC-like DNA-binding protein
MVMNKTTFIQKRQDVIKMRPAAPAPPSRRNPPTDGSVTQYWAASYIFHRLALPVVVRPTFQDDSVLHQHEFVELVLVEKGMARHEFPRRSQTLAAGDTFLVAGPQVHGYRDCRGLRVVNILIRNEFFVRHAELLRHLPGIHHVLPLLQAADGRRAGPAPRRFHLAPDDLALCLHKAEAILLQTRSRRRGTETSLHGLLLDFLATYSQCVSRHQHPLAAPGGTGEVEAVIHQMEARPTAALSLDAIIAATRLPARTLQRRFRAATSFTPHQYQLRLRLTEAARLLREGGLTIKEIADKTGFAYVSYFNRMFRKITGTTPAVFAGRRRGRTG